MKKNMTVCEPQISNALLTNPGIGFIAAPDLADSRIIQFQSLFSVYEVDQERQAEERVFGHLEENPAAYPEGTSLQKKMKAALLAGKCFGMGRGVRVIE